MNVSLTKKQEEYIKKQIDAGDFQNASELVRDAIRLHQFYRERVLKELKLEIEKGWESPASSKTVRQIIEERKQAHNV